MGTGNIVLTEFESEQSIIDLVDLHKYKNVFNPSIYLFEGITYLTFRAFSKQPSLPFYSYLIKYDPVNNVKQEINISELCLSYNIDVCADPKLLLLGDEVWLTFNTGYSMIFNSIYLIKVSGAIGQPYKCILDDRKVVEKNWAFFKKDNLIQAIYSIYPYRTIYLTEADENNKTLKFKFHDKIDCKILGKKKNLSIGTQLLYTNDSAYLIAHKKIRFFNKILYFGHFVSITDAKVKVHPSRLFHSYRSLLGVSKKYNKNLISCTYFSGLAIKNDKFLIAYGINDTSFDIKLITKEFIWQ
jgi:hypothetical protein